MNEQGSADVALITDGAVRRIELDGGALTSRAAQQLGRIIDDIVEDRSIRCVVLTSPAGSFCPGADSDLDPLSVEPAAALARLRPPVIAAIDGPCHSVGLELALAADIRLAGPTAMFSMPDLADGRLPSWGGTQRLPRVVGSATATEMMLLGTVLDRAGAVRHGLVSSIGLDTLDQIIEQLLGVGPLALELAKEAVHRGAELPLRDGLRLEGDYNHLLQTTEDRAEGLTAFFDKRPPDFAGR